jgi:hypothetical protein
VYGDDSAFLLLLAAARFGSLLGPGLGSHHILGAEITHGLLHLAFDERVELAQAHIALGFLEFGHRLDGFVLEVFFRAVLAELAARHWALGPLPGLRAQLGLSLHFGLSFDLRLFGRWRRRLGVELGL